MDGTRESLMRRLGDRPSKHAIITMIISSFKGLLGGSPTLTNGDVFLTYKPVIIP